MYYPTKNNPIHLVHRDGDIVCTYDNFDQLVHFWPYISRGDIGPGPSHKKIYENVDWLRELRRCKDGEWPAYHYEYILRCSTGDTINPADVHAAYRKVTPYTPGWMSHGWRSCDYRHFRSPRTTQERRWADAWNDEEFAPKGRACRNASNLIDAWDDPYGHNDKSWKTQSKRKHQWKSK